MHTFCNVFVLFRIFCLPPIAIINNYIHSLPQKALRRPTKRKKAPRIAYESKGRITLKAVVLSCDHFLNFFIPLQNCCSAAARKSTCFPASRSRRDTTSATTTTLTKMTTNSRVHSSVRRRAQKFLAVCKSDVAGETSMSWVAWVSKVIQRSFVYVWSLRYVTVLPAAN